MSKSHSEKGFTDPEPPAFSMYDPALAEKMKGDIFDKLATFILEMECVGSRVTCHPPPTDTDEDILLLVTDTVEVATLLVKYGCEIDGHYLTFTKGEFNSLRLGELNFIITENKTWFNDFMLATRVCKELNLMKKKERICVFSAIVEKKFDPGTSKIVESMMRWGPREWAEECTRLFGDDAGPDLFSAGHVEGAKIDCA